MIKFVTFADIVSLLNALFGFFALLMLFSKEFNIAFSLIFLALLADGLDGVIARRINKGKMGEYLEAMADMISLSIAPILFVYCQYYTALISSIFLQGVFYAIFIFFIICSIIRLSSFHMLKDKRSFIGLPASASTIFILVLAYVNIDYLYLLSLILIISLFMISQIRFPKPTIKVNTIAALLIILSILFQDTFNSLFLILLFIALSIYSIGGPIYLKYKKFV